MKFQEKYEDYLVHNGFVTEDELAHFGVPGMKWGVRKSVYKSMNRRQRGALRSYATSVGRHNSYFASKKKASARAKADAKQKARLEKALGTSINNESAIGSYKNHNLGNWLLNPFGNLGSVYANQVRTSADKGFREMSDKQLKEYMNPKNTVRKVYRNK